MKHYVIIHDWSNEYESDIVILGVTHTMEEAKTIFNNSVNEEKNYAEEWGYEIFTDCDEDFDAGEMGYYSTKHTRVYIQEVN